MLEHNFSWVIENKLAGVRGPRDMADLVFIKQKGVAVLVRLAEEEKAEVTAQDVLNSGLEDFHVPIPDYHAPTPSQIIQIVEFVRDKMKEGESVAVSCHAGVGRTGTILMCILVSMGKSFEEAETIMSQANRRPYETGDQKEAIRGYYNRLAKS